MSPCYLSLVIAAVGLSVACTPPSEAVLRVHDGLVVPGPRISEAAYAAYLEAAEHEANGRLAEAEAAYYRALEQDPDSAELWTRIAEIRCRLRDRPALALFEQATERYAGYAPLWVAKAHCHLVRGQPKAAREAALRAAKLKPNDPETTDVVVETLARTDDREAAARWLTAERLRNGTPPPAPPEVGVDEIDLALSRDDLALARHLATRVRLSQGELALRAALAGQPDLATEQGTLVLGADPRNADAWVALLAASDLSGNESQFAHWLRHPPRDPAEPSALGLETLADLVDRRVGQGGEPLRNLAAALRQGLEE